MNRREFIGALASTAATGALAQSPETAPASSSSSSITRTPLALIAPRSDGVEAVWAVNQLCKGRIEWECDDQTTGSVARDPFGFVPQGSDILRIRINNLKPGRSYRIRAITTTAANGEQEISPWKTFRPIDPAAKKSKFVVWNDTHINNESIKKLHELTPAADFLLWNGDTCNDWTSPELLVPTLLHPGQCDFTQGRPLLVAWGNHDVRGPHAFEMPRLTPTPNGRPFYAVRSGPVAAICLHTGEDKPDSHFSFKGRVAFDSLRREQAEWLADTIRLPEFRDAPFRIVFCHIPLRWTTEIIPDYDKGGFDHFSLRSRDAWHPALLEWKTQLVISGHTHRTAWIPPNETFPYGQLTGGGPAPKSATWMEAEASAEGLNLRVTDLEGKLRHEVNLKPLV